MGIIAETLREIFYPSHIKCIVCDAELAEDTRYCICPACKLPYNDTFCSVCGRAVAAQNLICDQCKQTVMPFAAARSSFVFEGAAATLVYKLKYRGAQYPAPVMAEFMADTYFSTDWQADVVTYVPIHKSRLRSRGYNQSELLANELSNKIGKECKNLLIKTVKTKNMARLNRAERQELIRGTFRVAENADVHGKTVLLVDDVLTTGSTASECTRMLSAAGAMQVYVLTFASAANKPQLL